jgi:ABC-type branched-subunit amino acid transport system ATPase component
MLTIRRALMTHPDLLILEEAIEGLAPLVTREIWNIIRPVHPHARAPQRKTLLYAAALPADM